MVALEKDRGLPRSRMGGDMGSLETAIIRQKQDESLWREPMPACQERQGDLDRKEEHPGKYA